MDQEPELGCISIPVKPEESSQARGAGAGRPQQDRSQLHGQLPVPLLGLNRGYGPISFQDWAQCLSSASILTTVSMALEGTP